jgi:hypothetical protein
MKFALLKNINFNTFAGYDTSFLFDDLNYKNYLEDKIEFIEFDDTPDLLKSISLIINNNIEILNAYYDDKYLIQSFYYNDDKTENFDKMIFVKRELHKDDTYTFIGHEHDIKFYNFLNVEMDDLIKIFKNKYIVNGVKIMSTGQIYDIQYVKKNTSKYSETLYFNGISPIQYLDVLSIVNIYDGDTVTEKIAKYSAKYSSEYIYIQKNINFCLIDIYTEMSASNKNEMASLLIDADVYGDIIINLQNILNDDKRILYVNKQLIINIINSIKEKKSKAKNLNFFNIYYEFS